MTNEIEYKDSKQINPFFSIWLSPRETVRYVLDHKELKYSLILAAIAGIPTALSSGNGLNLELSFWWMLVAAVVFGPILGLIGLGISAVIYTWVGNWFGGIGTYKEMAQAMGVALIPSIWLTPYWILSAFITHNVIVMTTTVAIIWVLVNLLLMISYCIWMVVIQSKIVGEVHQFSNWKGFATYITILLFVIIVLIFIFTFLISIL